MDYMKIIERKLKNVDSKICSLFEELPSHDRRWVSDMVIQFLRTFVEHVNTLLYASDHPQKEVIIGDTNIKESNAYIKKCGKYPYLKELLESLNKSVSHFVPEGDGAERLMLMYYANLMETKRMVKERFDIEVLHNIKKFPTDLDKTLDAYYSAIYQKLSRINDHRYDYSKTRYYVFSCHPVIVEESVFYEVTLVQVKGHVNKTDRLVVFSKESVQDNYAIQVKIVKQSVVANDFKMPVQFLLDYRVSIRPCELDRIADLCGQDIKNRSDSKQYIAIMNRINVTRRTLLDEITADEEEYQQWRSLVYLSLKPELDASMTKLRKIILSDMPGSNLARYFLAYTRNDVIVDQLADRSNNFLSYLFLKNESIPFDNMPFATSLYKHNVSWRHLIRCMDYENREHEFLARKVSNAAYENNTLYMDTDEEEFEYLKSLSAVFNGKLYSSKKQQQRRIGTFNKTLCIDHNVEETKNIILKLKEYAESGIENYENSMTTWIEERKDIDDDAKKIVLKNLFVNSKVGIIYGAAGTGKTRVVEYVTEYFSDDNILFLANTHPAVDNLRRRTGDKYTYSTIYSYLETSRYHLHDLIVIDECSMVSNKDIYRILERDNTKALLLVGDVYQIESIDFGNWFNFARYFLDKKSVHELTTPYRAKDNKKLLEVWNSVRTYDEHMFLKMQTLGCIEDLSDDIFIPREDDEIVLCLGYNGIYGINNINRFLQSRNSSPAIEWGVWSYKVGDRILFTDNHRFGNLLYNNLKGTIVGIVKYDNKINFTIELDKYYEEEDLAEYGIELVEQRDNGNSVISFDVSKEKEEDDDTDNKEEVVPFQIAYAVSIHKAQGLEYDSVKVVITKDIEERISHSIFYTAITRAKKSLKIYMSGEIESILMERFVKDNNGLMQAQKFAGHTGMRVKNRLSC